MVTDEVDKGISAKVTMLPCIRNMDQKVFMDNPTPVGVSTPIP